MNVQQSFGPPDGKGILYLVGTPIGNLEDITFRAVRILKEVDWIAAEDTRHTRKLLNHFEISTHLVSYHEHNKLASGQELIHKLLQGQSVALVSDAGLPAISDPGAEIVRDAVEEGIRVVPIPGANAALSALIISSLPTDQFTFVGFLPREQGKLRIALKQLKTLQHSLLFYESPYRVEKTLQAMLEVWGNRRVVLGRELTKRFEEVVRGSIEEALDWLSRHSPQGEYCIVASGGTTADLQSELWWETLSIRKHYDAYFDQGMERKAAMKQVALDRGIPKRDVYAELI